MEHFVRAEKQAFAAIVLSQPGPLSLYVSERAVNPGPGGRSLPARKEAWQRAMGLSIPGREAGSHNALSAETPAAALEGALRPHGFEVSWERRGQVVLDEPPSGGIGWVARGPGRLPQTSPVSMGG
jgi:hypothetical protein